LLNRLVPRLVDGVTRRLAGRASPRSVAGADQ
jgi:hypothetical protein